MNKQYKTAFVSNTKQKKEFENRKIQFKWYSMEKLLGDERIQMVNSDIVEYVKEGDSKNNS